MYDKIKHYLQQLFSPTLSDEDILREEYKVLAKQIAECKTLTELFTARARLIEYNEAIKTIQSPVWAKNNVKFLEAKWNQRYRIWKVRN